MTAKRKAEVFPTTLDLLLIALLERNKLNTIYDLQHKVGINPGAITHSLRRLTETGAVTRQPEGYRRRRAIGVTSVGQQILKLNWPQVLDEPVDDSHSLARLGWLVTIMSTRAGEARNLLEYQAARIERQEPSPAPAETDKEFPIRLYIWFLSEAKYHQAQAAAKALRQFARLAAALPAAGLQSEIRTGKGL